MCSPSDLGEPGSAQDNTESDVAPAVSGLKDRPGSVENHPTNGYRRKRAAMKMETADADWPLAKLHEISKSSHTDKDRLSVT